MLPSAWLARGHEEGSTQEERKPEVHLSGHWACQRLMRLSAAKNDSLEFRSLA